MKRFYGKWNETNLDKTEIHMLTDRNPGWIQGEQSWRVQTILARDGVSLNRDGDAGGQV